MLFALCSLLYALCHDDGHYDPDQLIMNRPKPHNRKEQVELLVHRYWKIVLTVIIALGIGMFIVRQM
jgi:hypothetical protein